MRSMITYDVSKKNTPVKDAMKEKGYLDYWKANEKTYYLPNTTLWKKDVSTATALQDLKDVVNAINAKETSPFNKIRLERAVAVDCSQWSAIEGDSYEE